MTDRPKISVVTPSFNSVTTIRDTIGSVLRQDYKEWEHIVMDGGSKDGALEILKNDPDLKWVSEKDEGHFHAMNEGHARASADLRITRNMVREAAVIQREHGHSGGWCGKGLQICFKAKRQAQKLFYRGQCDLVPGTWRLKPHMREKTEFSSNAGLDKLQAWLP